eukprot:15366790-Ditylum_brightwellii.AAC.1
MSWAVSRFSHKGTRRALLRTNHGLALSGFPARRSVLVERIASLRDGKVGGSGVVEGAMGLVKVARMCCWKSLFTFGLWSFLQSTMNGQELGEDVSSLAYNTLRPNCAFMSSPERIIASEGALLYKSASDFRKVAWMPSP